MSSPHLQLTQCCPVSIVNTHTAALLLPPPFPPNLSAPPSCLLCRVTLIRWTGGETDPWGREAEEEEKEEDWSSGYWPRLSPTTSSCSSSSLSLSYLSSPSSYQHPANKPVLLLPTASQLQPGRTTVRRLGDEGRWVLQLVEEVVAVGVDVCLFLVPRHCPREREDGLGWRERPCLRNLLRRGPESRQGPHEEQPSPPHLQ